MAGKPEYGGFNQLSINQNAGFQPACWRSKASPAGKMPAL